MFSEFYAESGLLLWPVLGMVILAVTFLMVMGWVVIGLRNSPTVARMAALPLEDDAGPQEAEEVLSHE